MPLIDTILSINSKEDNRMDNAKKLLGKLAIKAVKFLFSGMVTLMSFVEILAKTKGGNK